MYKYRRVLSLMRRRLSAICTPHSMQFRNISTLLSQHTSSAWLCAFLVGAYICMHVILCVCISTSACVNSCIHMCTSVWGHLHVFTQWLSWCMHTYVRRCCRGFLCVGCVYVCILDNWAWIALCVALTWLHMYLCMCVRRRMCWCMCDYVCTLLYAWERTYVCMCIDCFQICLPIMFAEIFGARNDMWTYRL